MGRMSTMRKIDTRHFRRASRSTSREVNRQIVLNLIREHQPLSRADLARRMGVARSALTAIVRELVETGAVAEGVDGSTAHGPGRPPTLLRVRTASRLAVAVDVRPEHTIIALADFDGRVISRDTFVTPKAPEALVEALAAHVEAIIAAAPADAPDARPSGVAVIVPGLVDGRSGRVLFAPRLGWRDVDLGARLSARLDIPVSIENAPVACALARLWLPSGAEGPADMPSSAAGSPNVRNFAYVSISDGVGVGLVANGEALRGEAHAAGEFGHVPLDPHGPMCVCGRRGCWESFTCNAATIGRYVDRVMHRRARADEPALDDTVEFFVAPPSIEDVVARARRGEEEAIWALAETGWHIGRGLAAVVSAFNPGRIYVGGEITAGWSFIEGPMRQSLADGVLTEVARRTPIIPDRRPAEYRLLGAVAVVAAPTFAAPELA